MTFTFHLSLYWVLLPVAALLALFVANAARQERGGYLSGLETLMALFAAAFVFLVVLCILLAIHLFSR